LELALFAARVYTAKRFAHKFKIEKKKENSSHQPFLDASASFDWARIFSSSARRNS